MFLTAVASFAGCACMQCLGPTIGILLRRGPAQSACIMAKPSASVQTHVLQHKDGMLGYMVGLQVHKLHQMLCSNVCGTQDHAFLGKPSRCVQVHVLHQMFPSNSSAVEAAYSWKDALRWLQQIAGALKYLHGLRPMVVHRDLKLENLLLTGTNPAKADAKLADFGLCKLIKVAMLHMSSHSHTD